MLVKATFLSRSNVKQGQSMLAQKRISLETSCEAWHLVGFSLDRVNKLRLYVDPVGNDKATAMSSGYAEDPTWPVGMMQSMRNITMLGAVDLEIDDVRFFTGVLPHSVFVDAFKCSHHSRCAMRSIVAPMSRRVICLTGEISDADESTYSKYSCSGGMHYDGSPIDVLAYLTNAGVVFEFKDTSATENSFEILRRSTRLNVQESPYEAVIMIEGALSGCGRSYKPAIYSDREASAEPGLVWHYVVKAKSLTTGDVLSVPYIFLTPWQSQIDGFVYAGASTVAARGGSGASSCDSNCCCCCCGVDVAPDTAAAAALGRCSHGGRCGGTHQFAALG